MASSNSLNRITRPLLARWSKQSFSSITFLFDIVLTFIVLNAQGDRLISVRVGSLSQVSRRLEPLPDFIKCQGLRSETVLFLGQLMLRTYSQLTLLQELEISQKQACAQEGLMLWKGARIIKFWGVQILGQKRLNIQKAVQLPCTQLTVSWKLKESQRPRSDFESTSQIAVSSSCRSEKGWDVNLAQEKSMIFKTSLNLRKLSSL